MIQHMLIAGGSRGLSLADAAHVAPRIGALGCACRGSAPHGTWLRADLATEAGIATVAALHAGRPLDALIFASGTSEDGAVTDADDFAAAPPDEAARLVAANLPAPIRLVQALPPSFGRGAGDAQGTRRAQSRRDGTQSRPDARLGTRRARPSRSAPRCVAGFPPDPPPRRREREQTGVAQAALAIPRST
jgi:NAD(P)-dependent dehydrogenase (short-subunit alcohol dehydrogenase family)